MKHNPHSCKGRIGDEWCSVQAEVEVSNKWGDKWDERVPPIHIPVDRDGVVP